MYKITVFLLLISISYLNAQEMKVYVDSRIPDNYTGSYSISGRNTNGNDGVAYKSLDSAANAAQAGTVVLIREGIYNTRLIPKNSGNKNGYITFRNYNNEEVVITGETFAPAIMINQKDSIVIEGLKIRNVRYWLSALGSDYIIIRNNTFEKALDPGGSSKTGIFFQSSNYGKVINNIIDESTQDNLAFIDSDYNLIEGNTITKARHTLWTFKCSNYNIVRNNYFYNEDQKIGEVFDCSNSGFGNTDFPKLNILDDTKHNVIEKNIFAYTPSPGDASPYSGIQYAGQNGIIRNNLFYECEGPPLSLSLYPEEAKYNYGNRIYNNVFYDNEFGAIDISGGTTGYTFYDQKIKNNIFYKNIFVRRDMRWDWYIELNNKPVQIKTARTSDFSIENNNIFHSTAEELYVIAYGVRTSGSNPPPQPLSWWESNHKQNFSDNLQTNPQFIDESNKDFHLQPGSPMIDAGAFLTITTNTGNNSTEMKVADASWFMDGFNIAGGDTIQTEGRNEYAVILSIDYNSRTLYLDRPLSWEMRKGVSLKYSDKAPDIGAYEYRQETVGIKRATADDKKLTLSPNPVRDTLIISIGDAAVTHIEKIIICNIHGQQVMTLDYKNAVNVSGLDSGVYNLMIIFRDGISKTKKFVKL